ncbi:MAG: regulator of (H+)-ATPase in vacuolar membrane [Sclerophora amabilis]|nr:MAG: regulator of (H+)-ATPase in vacuolar membrane [Sclerophora amabilis]
MSDNPSSPLLGSAEAQEGRRPPSKRSGRSLRSNASTESTPLLSREDDRHEYGVDQSNGGPPSPAASSLRSLHDRPRGKLGKRRRWPSAIALLVLIVGMIVIIALGFFAPAAIEEYASQAMVVEPTKLSIDSFTAKGVRARIQGHVGLDASRVKNSAVRNLGRAGTWIAKEVESQESVVQVFLPEYGNVFLGTATVPPMIVNIRNGHVNQIDFKSDVEPGDIDGIRRIANDWLEGRLGQLRIQGKTDLALKSGIIPLGSQSISESLVFEAQDLPAFPEFNITRLNFHEVSLPAAGKGMAADASVTLLNSYPVQFTVPPLGFQILVPNCAPNDPYILLADATTARIHVEPLQEVNVDVDGIVRQLPDILTTACPNSNSSPLDTLLGGYIHGEETTIYVRGSESPATDTPDWISDLISSVTVPLPFPGHTFDNLIKNFSLADVHFGLPDPTADPGSPEAQPKLSATVKALVSLPKEMNFPIDVSHVRADADVYYHGTMLGHLDLHKWQKANSSRAAEVDGKNATLLVESVVENAPLQITNDDVFSELVRALVFGRKGVVLGIKADVDVEVDTALGTFIIKEVPAEGKIAVKPISGSLDSFAPKIGSLKILDTSETTLVLQALVNLTNPTAYSASVPFIDINILSNDTLVGHATARDVEVVPGLNENIIVEALWDPASPSGKKGRDVGRELLSQYISGWNTTLTLKAHEGSIPSQPALGRVLSSLAFELPTPKLKPPNHPGDGDDDDDDGGDEKDDGPHFIKDATSVGVINYDMPFAVPPGATLTPKMPVDWSTESVGYDVIKKALGGQLKLDAKARVGIKIDRFAETVWFVGGGIGAKVRI